MFHSKVIKTSPSEKKAKWSKTHPLWKIFLAVSIDKGTSNTSNGQVWDVIFKEERSYVMNYKIDKKLRKKIFLENVPFL